MPISMVFLVIIHAGNRLFPTGVQRKLVKEATADRFNATDGYQITDWEPALLRSTVNGRERLYD